MASIDEKLSAFVMDSESSGRKWVRTLWEPMANIETVKECVAVGDIHGDNEFKLILVDIIGDQCRLKLLKGITVINDSYLAETPVGIIIFVCDPGDPPCVGVAVGSSLLVYRNMKPYYRFSLPPDGIHPAEIELWKSAMKKLINHKELFDGLNQIRSEVSLLRMSFHSQSFLTLETEEERKNVLAQISSQSGEKLNISNQLITCATTIKKNETGKAETDIIILGTELGTIYWIDSQAYNVLAQCKIGATPFKLFAHGQFDLESRLFVCTRESDVIVIKKNSRDDIKTATITMKSPVSTIAASKSQIVMATRDNHLVFCTFKGRKQSEVQVSEPIIDMESFFYEPRQYSGILVAFRQRVDIYMDNFVVDSLKIDSSIDWIKFGRLGREDAVLLIGTILGGIGIYIFRRTATLTAHSAEIGPPAAQSVKLSIPKKSKAFIDQSLREREDPPKMHQTYQRDLYMLRLHITKAYTELTSSNTLPTKESEKMDVSVNVYESEKMDVSVNVYGFGPNFRIEVKAMTLTEVSNQKRWISFKVDKNLYKIEREMIPMPILMKNVEVNFTNAVRCLHPENGMQGEVKIIITVETKKAPVWLTTFEMPLSEQPMIS
uniref:Bardet-Biedl syndrome 1 N-terminal domain-containing protein n=1 Tax=Panagrolaimus sp. JU765 TaxID=591449 RepID=A0AC34QCC4_9BILA